MSTPIKQSVVKEEVKNAHDYENNEACVKEDKDTIIADYRKQNAYLAQQVEARDSIINDKDLIIESLLITIRVYKNNMR